MGLCGSKENLTPEQIRAKERSKELDRKMMNRQAQDSSINKLLLLGAGESGKSTMFKQMMQIYGKKMGEEERRAFRPVIHTNVLSSIQTLLLQTDEQMEHSGGKTAVDPSLEGAKQHLLDISDTDELTPELANMVRQLWNDAGVQHTYSIRSRFQLTDSAKYFFDQVDTVANPSYVPSQQDVLRSRVRTTGIVEEHFQIEGNQFSIFDVGGQRNERKKWIHCFSEVTAVLFVAALSEYDMVLFEDETTNRMDEALNLFDEICNSRWFRKTSIILMLNKKDLFAEKIARVPLDVWDPSYAGPPHDYEAAVEHLRQRFENQNRNPQKTVYTHVTCATDTSNMQMVFSAVKDIVIRQSLREGGLLA